MKRFLEEISQIQISFKSETMRLGAILKAINKVSWLIYEISLL